MNCEVEREEWRFQRKRPFGEAWNGAGGPPALLGGAAAMDMKLGSRPGAGLFRKAVSHRGTIGYTRRRWV